MSSLHSLRLRVLLALILVAVIPVGLPGLRQMLQRYVDEIVALPDRDIFEAMIWVMERCKLVVEGAAAAPVAGKPNAAARHVADIIRLKILGKLIPAPVPPPEGIRLIGPSRFPGLRFLASAPSRPRGQWFPI